MIGSYQAVADIAGQRFFSTTIPRHADITLTVDGKEVTVPQGMLMRGIKVDPS